MINILSPRSRNFFSCLDSFLSAESDDPNFSTLGIQYYRAYYKEREFEDVSFFILIDDTPVLAFIGALESLDDASIRISAFGQPCFYVEPRDSYPIIQPARKILKQKIEEFFSRENTVRISYRDCLRNNCLSPVSQYLLGMGAVATPMFQQEIDLTKSVSHLKQEVRKSYKSLINWGMKNLSIKILDASAISFSQGNEFRKLHMQVAGRETRTEETWRIQHRMIENSNAFLVLGYHDNVLITGAFFTMNRKYCYYGVSASKRELFDKPMSHSIVWSAILHAKERGCTCMIMGQQLYSGLELSTPTEKELNISTFKRGFGGETKAEFLIEYPSDREIHKNR